MFLLLCGRRKGDVTITTVILLPLKYSALDNTILEITWTEAPHSTGPCKGRAKLCINQLLVDIYTICMLSVEYIIYHLGHIENYIFLQQRKNWYLLEKKS